MCVRELVVVALPSFTSFILVQCTPLPLSLAGSFEELSTCTSETMKWGQEHTKAQTFVQESSFEPLGSI